ncbi:MAG: uroporphyrinogen decarboxylase family protein [Actinomycetota bacterium]
MTARDRIEAALALSVADRPPAGWWGHTFEDEWSPAELARATLERQRRFGWDYVKFQPRACCFSEAFGAVYRPSGDPYRQPVQVRQPVRSLASWGSLPAADASAPAFAEQVEALRIVASELGPGVPVIQTVFSPLMVAAHLAGKDNARVARELRQHPEVVEPALEKIAAALVDFSARSVEAGAAGIFYAIAGFASLDLVSSRAYEAVALPHDLAVLEALPQGAWFNVLHLCGDDLNFAIASALPVQAVSWDVHGAGNPSLSEGRDRSGKAVLGGVGRKTTLVSGTPDDVAAEVRAAMEDTAGKGFILGPGCSVPPEAPEANLEAMRPAPA